MRTGERGAERSGETLGSCPGAAPEAPRGKAGRGEGPLKGRGPRGRLERLARSRPSCSGRRALSSLGAPAPHPAAVGRRPSPRPPRPARPGRPAPAGRRGKVGERAAPAGESVNGRPGGSRALARPRHAGAGSADDRGAWGRRRAPLARQVLRLEMSPLVVARSPPERARRAAARSPRGRPAVARRHRR